MEDLSFHNVRSVNGASPSKSEDKAGRTVLTLIQEDLSFHNVRSVNGASPSKSKIKLGEQYSH